MECLAALPTTGNALPTLPASLHRPHLPREMSNDRVWAQVGWLGQSGTVYALDDDVAENEPGGFRELYVSIGAWKDLGDGHYGIKG